ncbi:SCO family protein [Pseudomonas baetica]|uniref:SCO family protein n=1 Tax=Pseudomonas baetica TaxID=674054 RepID=UPI0024059D59|nr:SCO family protein [Pseudomonas baetica]MDF9778123.1 cytochrome oxidase Cu insertion factor (SCO1/SenC/PrrC family) [Pseudomonas baetica]
MSAIDGVAQGVRYCIFSSMALTHEGHELATPDARPATDTHDGKTWFTDTPLQDQNGITFISLTSDPQRDTPAVLKAYTLKQGIDGPHWFFLTGDKVQVGLVLGRIGQIVPTPEQHSTQLIVGDVANRRWSKIRPDAPATAIAQRLQLLTMPVASR